MRRFAVLIVVVLGVVPVFLRAQAPRGTLPISGKVVDIVGAPIPNAQVVLARHTFRVPDAEGVEMLGRGQTDAEGRFDLGSLALNSEVAFPLESGVMLEFAISKDGEQKIIDNVKFTAPRENSIVTSVNAEIWVH